MLSTLVKLQPIPNLHHPTEGLVEGDKFCEIARIEDVPVQIGKQTEQGMAFLIQHCRTGKLFCFTIRSAECPHDMFPDPLPVPIGKDTDKKERLYYIVKNGKLRQTDAPK